MSDLDIIALTHTVSHLASLPGVRRVSDWQRTKEVGVWILDLEISLINSKPTPHVPELTKWLLVVDFNNDPWGRVNLFPGLGIEAISTTFPHQQFNGNDHETLPCRSGNICTDSWLHGLASSRVAQRSEPIDTINRIVWHVSRGIEWLEQAASNILAQPGSIFELPDFKTGGSSFDLAYYEDESTLALWSKAERAGIVELAQHGAGVFFPKAYYGRGKRNLLYKPPWGTTINELSARDALWIRLDAVPTVSESQVPKTFNELLVVCQQQNIDLTAVLTPLVRQNFQAGKGTSEGSMLLIGMPISQVVGGNHSRLHWQAINLLPSNFKGGKKALPELIINRLKTSTPLKWARQSENWSPKELLSRGSISAPLSSRKVLLIGAGALGSALANQLVRMGVSDLTIVDFDEMQGGNLVRHQLTLLDINKNKATSLANKLNLTNPSAKVVGLPLSIGSNNASLKAVLEASELVIDATADDLVLKVMSNLLVDRETPVISCSLGLNAERLFLYAEGRHFSWEEFERWFYPFRLEEDAMAQRINLPRGAGCWHPLTPAKLNRVEGLAGIAVEYIEHICANTDALPLKIEHKWPSLQL